MRNLRLFIVKNYFFFLFLVFEIMSISLLVSYNDYQRSTFMNSSSTMVGYMMEKKSEFTEYFHLKDANLQLMEENAKLRSMLDESQYEKIKSNEYVLDSNKIPQYTYRAAKVINSTVQLQDNFMTINRGSNDGIRKDMGVTNGTSIVGFVKDVSPHYATIISVLNKNFVLSVKLQKTNDHGLINWEGIDDKTVVLKGITVDAPVEPGDTVVTKGSSARFPEGVLVGTVKEVYQKPGSMHHTIIVNLATDFSAVFHVYVIENHLRDEQMELEASIKNEVIKP